MSVEPAFGGRLEEAGGAVRAEDWDWFLKGLPGPVRRALFEEWSWQAHGGQEEPGGDWRVWLMMAGRGFGKTRTGAEWVSRMARETSGARIALVGGSFDEVVKVMIEGPSGLLAVARAGEAVRWRPTAGVVEFPGGAEAFVYSAEAPEKLRGPEHHFAWCDELAKWRKGEAAWDNLQMGMRLGERPRLVVTTTPRVRKLVRRVRGLAGVVETGGGTAENVHLPPAFRDWMEETYGGTRLGRQELEGVLLGEADGALWSRAVIEAARTREVPEMKRVLVGVDPPASAEGNACGIVVCGMGRDGVAYVLADCTVRGMRPEGWAGAVARAARAWGAERAIAEKNQGGDMVESVLRAADPGLAVRLVSASKGKSARAEPVAQAFETGKAKLGGRFSELEDEMAAMTAGGGFDGQGRGASPDRADAMVWAMNALLKPAAEPRVMVL